jgi:hypothetical protein
MKCRKGNPYRHINELIKNDQTKFKAGKIYILNLPFLLETENINKSRMAKLITSNVICSILHDADKKFCKSRI